MSTPLLLHVEAPKGADVAKLNPFNAPDAGVVVVTIAPNARHDHSQLLNVLERLGCSIDSAGTSRRAALTDARIVSWASTRRIHTLVAVHAQWADRDFLDRIADLCAASGTTLALVTLFDTGHDLREHVLERWGDTITWKALLRRVTPSSRKGHASAVKQPVRLPRPPMVGFPLFRAALRAQCTPSQFKIADQLYRTTFKGWLQAKPATADEAHTWLNDRWQNVGTFTEAVIVARAAQSAALTTGNLLKVDAMRLSVGWGSGQQRPLTSDEMSVLLTYPDPARAASVVLVDNDWSAQDVAQLTINDVDTQGNVTGRPWREPTGDTARFILRAARTAAILSNSYRNDPLIFRNWRTVQSACKDAAITHGLPLNTRELGKFNRPSESWRRGLGVSFQSVTDAPNSKGNF